MNRRQVALTSVLVALALAGACTPSSDAGPRIDAPAPAYAAVTLDGDSVRLADLEGKVVLLNFWATWCTPCRMETPYLQSLYEEHAADGLEIVGASMDTRDALDQVGDFVEEYGVTYPILVDPGMRGMDVYRVVGLPATFLIDRDGVIRWMRLGPIAENDPDFLNALGTVLE